MNDGPYRPLPRGVALAPSEIHGVGVVATRDWKGQHFIGVGWVEHPSFQDGLIRTALGGFMNHSDEPNCERRRDSNRGIWRLWTLREIAKGEELTIRYKINRPEE